MERTADVRALLDPADRYLLDTLERKAEQRFADRLTRSPASQARTPEEPREVRRPVGDRMNVGNWPV